MPKLGVLAACVVVAVLVVANAASAQVVIDLPVCGDGVPEGTEDCDDGNVTSGDGCSATCMIEPAACGNGIVQAGEECDDGNRLSGDGCDQNCQGEQGTAPICGNGTLERHELCDDGNGTSGDGCFLCQVEAGWDCSNNTCKSICGDGRKVGLEQCDDDNLSDFDGCDHHCRSEHGWDCTSGTCEEICDDGYVVGSEACDVGTHDGCTADCRSSDPGFDCDVVPHPQIPTFFVTYCRAICGDGIVTSIEGCDDENASDYDGCSADCEQEPYWSCTGAPSTCDGVCGDGVAAGSEFCDDGKTQFGGCLDDCSGFDRGITCSMFHVTPENLRSIAFCSSICGDGIVSYLDGCDDQNSIEDDGCTGCIVEDGYECAGEPSVCQSCGNGRVEGTEACDDGTIQTGDGCGDCAVEAGFACDDASPSTCAPICGDGLVVTGEECDDENVVNTDACTNACTAAACGDGFRWEGQEECDDGPGLGEDGCMACVEQFGWYCDDASPSTCVTQCGDAKRAGTEECDLGALNNDVRPDACRTDCTKERCGDGVEDTAAGLFDLEERCDDGALNGLPGACNSSCTDYVPGERLVRFYDLERIALDDLVVVFAEDYEWLFPFCLPEPEDYARVVAIEGVLQSFEVLGGELFKLPEDTLIRTPVIAYGHVGVNGVIGMAQTGGLGMSAASIMAKAGTTIGLFGLGGSSPDPSAPLNVCPCSPEESRPLPVDPDPGPCGDEGVHADCLQPTPEQIMDIELLSEEGGIQEVAFTSNCHFEQCVEPETPNPFGDVGEELVRCAPSFGGGDVPRICTMITGGESFNCPGYCEGDFDGICTMLGGESVGRDLQCDLMNVAYTTPDQDECFDFAMDEFEGAQGKYEFVRHGFRDRYAACAVRPDLEYCKEHRLDSPFDESDNDPPTYKFCDNDPEGLREDNDGCVICGLSIRGGCVPLGTRPIGPDDTVVTEPKEAQPEAKKPNDNTHVAGDPVGLGSGALVFSVTDIEFPSRGVPFSFTRNYTSGGDHSGLLGPGWTTSLEEYIEPVGDRYNRAGAPYYCVAALPEVRCLYHNDESGGRSLYVFDGATGVFTSADGGFSTIKMHDDGTGYAYVMLSPGGFTKKFDLTGQLRSVRDDMGYGITLHWILRDADVVAAEGAGRKTTSRNIFERHVDHMGMTFEGVPVTVTGTFDERISLFARQQLEAVVDSYGREFKMVYETHPGPNAGPVPEKDGRKYPRRRLQAIKYREQDLVQYEYAHFSPTLEWYLTKVTRLGMNESLPAATPIITHYEYQHDVLLDALAGLNGDPQDVPSELGRGIATLLSGLEAGIADCANAILLDPTNSTTRADRCGQLAVNPDRGLPGQKEIDLAEAVIETLADNITAVYRGDAKDRTTVELESYYEVDPRSADFDRVLNQKWGVLDEGGELDVLEQADTTVHRWQSRMPSARVSYLFAGFPEDVAEHIPNPAFDPENTDGEPRVIPNPRRRAAWFARGVQLPSAALAPIPTEQVADGGVAGGADDGEADCDAVHKLIELPAYDVHEPAAPRVDVDVDAVPTLVRSHETCAAIAGRWARNHRRNAAPKYVSEVLFEAPERRAMEWDLARVCAWTAVDRRDGATEFYGLNFRGQPLVTVMPSPTLAAGVSPQGATAGYAVTQRLYNADGNILLEVRPDGSTTRVEYPEDAWSAGTVLQRGLPVSVTETPAPGMPAPQTPRLGGGTDPTGARTWRFAYERLFQQVVRVEGPDGVVTESRYDYQQLADGTRQAEALQDRFFALAGFHVGNVFDGVDYDGDGTSGHETSSGLVAQATRAVDTGEGVADVGTRITRDDNGLMRASSSIKDLADASQDESAFRYFYYASLADSEVGKFPAEGCKYPCGPLALTQRLRTPDPASIADVDEEFVIYDPLGGVRLSRRNDDVETDVITRRDSVGHVKEQEDAQGLVVTSSFNARGEKVEEVRIDARVGATSLSPAQRTVTAWGRQGLPIGSCTDLVDGACAGFDEAALSAALEARAGGTSFAEAFTAGRASSLLFYDRDDRPSGAADAAGGRSRSMRNLAGVVVSETLNGTPNVTTTMRYDVAGRVIGAQTADLFEAFEYDGYGRAIAAQTHAASLEVVPGAGTIARIGYDVLDRPLLSYVEGDDGTGTRRLLSVVRVERNEAGAARARHHFAAETPPIASLQAPGFGGSGASAVDDWATEALRYDAQLRPVRHEREGIGAPTRASYDGFGLKTLRTPTRVLDVTELPRARTREVAASILDGDGTAQQHATSRTRFDGAGRIVEETRRDDATPVDRVRTYAYDGLGQQIDAFDETDRSRSVDYDSAGRPVLRLEFDEDGAPERCVRFGYDAIGRLRSEEPLDRDCATPIAPPTQTAYDALGRKLNETSASFMRDFTYDDASRLTDVFRSLDSDLGGVRHFSFVHAPNTRAVADVFVDGEPARSFTRDGLDRVYKALDQNRVLVPDDPQRRSGARPRIESRVTYDALGRVRLDETRAAYPAGGHPLGGQGQVLIAKLEARLPASFAGPSEVETRAGELLSFAYDDAGMLAAVARSNGALGRTVTATLQSEGGLWTQAQVSSNGGSAVTLAKERNAFGEIGLSSMSLPGAAAPARFDAVLRGPSGKIVAELRQGTLSPMEGKGYRYDGRGRLEAHTFAARNLPSLAQFQAWADEALADEALGASIIPPQTQVPVTVGDADQIERSLADERRRKFIGAYKKDEYGVPPEVIGAAKITMDAHRRVANDTELTYVYDGLDRLVAVHNKAGEEELNLSYDGVGRRRVERRRVTSPSGTATQEVVLEYLGANVVEETKLGTRDVVFAVTHAPGIDAPLFASNGPTSAATPLYTLSTNARGDVVAALDHDANRMAEETSLDPWGEKTLYTRQGSNVATCIEGLEGPDSFSRPKSTCAVRSAILQRFGIGGARAHGRTKLVDLRNRVYATHLRGFLTQDPLGSVDSYGLWNYVAADPINLRDPWGLAASPEGGVTAFRGTWETEDGSTCTSTDGGRNGMCVRQTGSGGMAPQEPVHLGGLNGKKPAERTRTSEVVDEPEDRSQDYDRRIRDSVRRDDGDPPTRRDNDSVRRKPGWSSWAAVAGASAAVVSIWGIGNLAAMLRRVEAGLMAIVPPGADLFGNTLPSELPAELARAERLGVRPFHFSDPEFPRLANEGPLKWAVTPQGELRFIPKWGPDGQELAHTVLTGGEPVAAAGEAEIAVSGTDVYVLELNNHSGHYLPSDASLEIGRAAFEAHGITWLE